VTNFLASFPLAKIKDQNLCQLLKAAEVNSKQTYAFTLSTSELLLDQRLLNSPVDSQPAAALNEPGELELVVLQDCTIEMLLEICQQCQLQIVALNNINQRLQINSYRFAVRCDDVSRAREVLVKLATNFNCEMALINQAPQLEQPGLLVMDMDSTAISIECIDEIAALAGVGEEVAQVTELAMQGQLDFAQSLTQRVSKLAGADESILTEVADKLPLMPGLTTLVSELQNHQWQVAIASGGFTYFAQKLKDQLGLTAINANRLEIINGKLSGKILGDIVDAKAKAQTLQQLALQHNIPQAQCIGMGDGANDLLLMEAAALGVAYKAKPIVLSQADAPICHSGLDCLLHYLK
jgi:phosphoserine phosphatase